MGFFNESLPIFNSLLIIFAMAFTIYRTFKGPDEEAEKQLGINKASCKEKHKRIDEIFDEMRISIRDINNTFISFRQNDFHHIEENTSKINERMAKMEGKMNTIVKIMTEVLNRK